MGPWASAVVAVASLAAVFFAVMGFRGLIEAVENSSGRCVTYSRTTVLPLPAQRHECCRCHYGLLRHPVFVDASGAMHGVLTRRDVLDQALSEETCRAGLGQMLIENPVVASPDETLRTVANRIASSGVTRMPVVEQASRRVVGVVSLAQLLQGRLRDVREARETERVVRFRLVIPTHRSSRRDRLPLA